MRQPSVMAHNFAQVPDVSKPRSTFNRSHSHQTTMDAGWLYPIFCDEILPGDTVDLRFSLFGRLGTPINPIMHNCYFDWFAFFVPNRLVWENWQKFCGEQTNPADSTDYLIPVMTISGGFAADSLGDHFGLPTNGGTFDVSALPFRGYHEIWDHWFRHQDFQDSVNIEKGDTVPSQVPLRAKRRRNKRPDYFTTCASRPQKSDSVLVPAGLAPLQGIGFTTQTAGAASGTVYESDGTSGIYANHYTSASSNIAFEQDVGTGNPSFFADVTSIMPTINALREAVMLQRAYEIDQRGGTRYPEILKHHFGVTSPDHRMQIPEFIQSGSALININQVEQTSSTDATTPQGNLAAYGTVGIRNAQFVKSFVEHGYLFILGNLRADITYQHGINRMWSRSTRFDFYWPAFANLGEQPVYNREIYVTGSPATDDLVFGYQEAHAAYRYYPSLITGKFRSNAAGTLDPWHLGTFFGATPPLDGTFFEDNPDFDRVMALPDEPHLLVDSYFHLRHTRCMPTFSIPGFGDRF